MRDINVRSWSAALALAAAFGIAGCSGSSTDSESTLTVAGDAPIAYAKRSTALNINPTNGCAVRRRGRPDDPREVLAERA